MIPRATGYSKLGIGYSKAKLQRRSQSLLVFYSCYDANDGQHSRYSRNAERLYQAVQLHSRSADVPKLVSRRKESFELQPYHAVLQESRPMVEHKSAGHAQREALSHYSVRSNGANEENRSQVLRERSWRVSGTSGSEVPGT